MSGPLFKDFRAALRSKTENVACVVHTVDARLCWARCKQSNSQCYAQANEPEGLPNASTGDECQNRQECRIRRLEETFFISGAGGPMVVLVQHFPGKYCRILFTKRIIRSESLIVESPWKLFLEQQETTYLPVYAQPNSRERQRRVEIARNPRAGQYRRQV